MKNSEKIKTKFYKINKEDLLKDLPERLYLLKVNYNFWFGGILCRAKKDITELVNRTRNRHRITVYLYEDRSLYFVIYANKFTEVYYCNEYTNDKSDSRVLYFMRKLKRYYLKASKEYEIQQFSQSWDQYKRS